VVHSHPAGVTNLSLGDLAYAQKVFGNPKNQALDRFFMPFVVEGRLIPFVIGRRAGIRAVRVRPARLLLF